MTTAEDELKHAGRGEKENIPREPEDGILEVGWGDKRREFTWFSASILDDMDGWIRALPFLFLMRIS